MKKRLLAVAIIVTFLFGTMSFAKDAEPIRDETITINAEEVGIRTVAIGDDFADDEVVPDEPEDNKEVVEDDVVESDETFVDESDEPEEDVGDTKEEPVLETPEGMKEGYVSNTFYKPDEHTECKFIHCASFDEDACEFILEEWCEVCGEGTERTITEEEFENLGVEADVEF